jgi:hypothetical protein
MGIKPLLINVPGHCFLGYYLDDEETKIRFLETTMVSNDRYIKNPKAQIVSKSYEIYRQNIPQNLKLSDLNKAYYAEFYDALVSAKSTYDKNIEKNSSRVVVINVEKQRQFIKPIPYYQ